MRVALIAEGAGRLAPSGEAEAEGQSRHVAELAAALMARQVEVDVYTRRDEPDSPELTTAGTGIRVRRVPVGPPERTGPDEQLAHVGDFGHWLADRWQRGEDRPDVVHAHYWTSGLAAVTATRRTHIPVVQTYHVLGTVEARNLGAGGDEAMSRRVGMERALGQAVDRVVAQSTEEVVELVGIDVPRKAITVVPAGVDTERFSPKGRVAGRGGGPRVLAVGRFLGRRGFDDLIQAMAYVPEAELVVVGGPDRDRLDDDPDVQALRAVATGAGVRDRLRFLGAVVPDRMPELYRSADLVACTPGYEPFGLVPLEAMACGVPVVATAVGGMKDTVIDGVTGVLVPPGDVRAIGGAIRELLGDEIRLMAYGSAGVDRIRSRYSWERTAAELLRVYGELTGVPQEEIETDAEAEPAT